MRKVVSEQVYDHNDVSRMQSERCAMTRPGQCRACTCIKPSSVQHCSRSGAGAVSVDMCLVR